MRPSTGFVLLLLAGVVAAQVTNPPPICFAFNDPPPALPWPPALPLAYITYYGSFVSHFTAPATSTIDRIDLWNGFTFCYGCSPQAVTITIYPTQVLGGAQSGPPLAAYSGLLTSYAPDGFHPFTGPPISVIGGATYALSFQGYPAVTNFSQYALVCFGVPHDPVGAVQLPYQFVGTNYCFGSGVPASGTVGLSLRFRAAACGPGPPASVAPLGAACGAAPGSTPSSTLLSSTPPTLGGSFTILVGGPANETAYVFWSGGVNPAGSLIAPGSSPCVHYLDVASLTTLASQGAEPIVIATIPPNAVFPDVGNVSWTFPVPPFPVYAGLVIGIQALIVGPSGTIPLGGGLFARSTTALQLTLGY